MKHLLNTLYVTSKDVYLSLDGENIVASRSNEEICRFPLHGISDIIVFSYYGASPSLMGECAKRRIGLTFCTPNGKFLARIVGDNNGNVLLRREQYRIADNMEERCGIARNFIFGKIYNARWVLERGLRDHADKIDKDRVKEVSDKLKSALPDLRNILDEEKLRGVEGINSSLYFSVFDELILTNKDNFKYEVRTRRPPMDPVNALLSFAYTILAAKCSSALESVGLDSYVGFMHRDRPGRYSLALDLVEELRASLADRFVLTLINNKVVNKTHFLFMKDGAVFLNDDGRSIFLKHWQERMQEQLIHPFLSEKIQWGLVPYVQSLLLARFIRGDLDEYPPFLWK